MSAVGTGTIRSDTTPRGNPRADGTGRGVLAALGRVASWLVLLGTVAVLLASVVVPRAADGQAYTVLTGSMQPALVPGDLVVVRPVPAGRVAVGDVITYQVESGKPAVVTHRVVGVGYVADGTVRLRTRGDANGAADPEPVRIEQVRGVVWYSLPWLGHLNTAIRGPQRTMVVGVAVTALLGYAVIMFVSAARDRRRARLSPEGAR